MVTEGRRLCCFPLSFSDAGLLSLPLLFVMLKDDRALAQALAAAIIALAKSEDVLSRPST
jgi:hypothetical protein